MNQDFRQHLAERSNPLRIDVLVDGLLAFIAVSLVAFGVEALLRATH